MRLNSLSSSRIWLACLLSAGWLVSAPTRAQSLLELYDAATGFDASLQSARAQAEASAARADHARAGLLPQLGLQAGANRNWMEAKVASVTSDQTYNVLNGSLVGSQPLYRPANRLTWDQGKTQAEVALQQLDAAGQDLIVRLSQAYFDVLAAQDGLTFVRALKKSVAEQLEAAKRNFELGNATITDSREAQARFDLALAQEIAAENDLHVKKLALDQLTGRPNTEPSPLAQPIQLPALAPDNVNDWVSKATEQHPAVMQSRLALDVARLETAKAKTGHLPTVDLQASVGLTRYPDGNPSITSAPGSSYRNRNASVGVVMNWPLFSGLSVQNKIRETLALEDKARADLEQAQRTVAQATRAAFFSVQSGVGQVNALEAAEASSQTALEANLLGYKVGVRINIDVLNAQSQLFQTKRDLAKARYDVLVGILRLKQASGVLAAGDLLPINQMLKP